MKNSHKYSLAAALSLPLATGLTHCGARTGFEETDEISIVHQSDAGADADANHDASPDASPDADADLPPVQNITRAELARALKEEIMYYPDFEETCAPSFPDIQPNTPLCRTTNFLLERGVMQGFPDGNFKPNNHVNHAELWKYSTTGLQFTPYSAPCLSKFTDLPSDTWYYSYAGALCEKGITLSDTSEAHPADPTTIQELTKMKTQIIAYLSQPMDRKTMAEVVAYTFFNNSPTPGGVITDCVSKFSDIPNNSLTCFHTNFLVDQGLLTDTNLTFLPNDQLTNGQMAKMYVLAAGFPAVVTGCSGNSPDQWFTGYMDALCDAGYINDQLDPIAAPTRWVASQLAWDIDFDKQ